MFKHYSILSSRYIPCSCFIRFGFVLISVNVICDQMNPTITKKGERGRVLSPWKWKGRKLGATAFLVEVDGKRPLLWHFLEKPVSIGDTIGARFPRRPGRPRLGSTSLSLRRCWSYKSSTDHFRDFTDPPVEQTHGTRSGTGSRQCATLSRCL